MIIKNDTVHASRLRYYLSAAIAFIILGGIGFALWKAWPLILLSSIQWQREINMQLTDLLYQAKAHSVTAGLYLAGFSFLYGALHSIGPGHGKMIVTTYLATHPTKVKVSLVLTILSAFLQAIVAIVLVSVLLMLFNSTMREVNSEANRFMSLSFYAMAILGAIIVYRSTKQLWQRFKIKVQTADLAVENGPFQSFSKLDNDSEVGLSPVQSVSKTHVHQHDENGHCGCGHTHFASAEDINNASSLREYIGIIVSIGIRPCTGAILALLFANVVGAYWLGVISAFVMSIGTALTTSTIALMTISGKKVVAKYLGASTHSTSTGAVILQLLGGTLLVLFGLLLMQVPVYGMSPILS
ncbi:nickel/cobalt transporter [Vibrio sp. S4M6]|uniref:nickel/cobalt transporter n=1 Tax=Vibrio sinus TaxID=2946865 RepID=UPI00202AC01B|nr:nickel/cobalt transporter [Vibrio sinus]MCL9782262.1 nickel/cobalt transporter [Vibrio sinus]